MVQERIYNYFERNPQLHVLFIFDRMDIIQTELGEVKEWADGYIYKVFDGAWFNTKYAIENTWKQTHCSAFSCGNLSSFRGTATTISIA